MLRASLWLCEWCQPEELDGCSILFLEVTTKAAFKLLSCIPVLKNNPKKPNPRKKPIGSSLETTAAAECSRDAKTAQGLEDVRAAVAAGPR